MIKLPNYNVVVPTTPDLTLYMKPRKVTAGERNNLKYEISVTDVLTVQLPWLPLATNWVEIYNNDVRIVNPRIKSITGGDLFELY